MKNNWTKNDLKFDKNGKLRKYYVDKNGVVHEVRKDIDTEYPAPHGYSKAFNGVFYLMIDGLKCDTMKNIYGINTSHEDMVIYTEKTMHEDGGRTNYTEMIKFHPTKEPTIKCTTQVLDKDCKRIESKCKVEYVPFL